VGDAWILNGNEKAKSANLYCPSAITWEASRLNDPQKLTEDQTASCVLTNKCYTNPLQVVLKYNNDPKLPFEVYSQQPVSNAGRACYGFSTTSTQGANRAWQYQCGKGLCAPGCPRDSFDENGIPTPKYGTKFNGACPDYFGLEARACRNSAGVCGDGKAYCTDGEPAWSAWDSKDNLQCLEKDMNLQKDANSCDKAKIGSAITDKREFGTNTGCVCKAEEDKPKTAGEFACKACAGSCPTGSVFKAIRVHVGKTYELGVPATASDRSQTVQVCGVDPKSTFCQEDMTRRNWLQRDGTRSVNVNLHKFKIEVKENAITATLANAKEWTTDLQFLCVACLQRRRKGDPRSRHGHWGPLRPRIDGIPDIVDSKGKTIPRGADGQIIPASTTKKPVLDSAGTQRQLQTHDTVERTTEAWSDCDSATITHTIGTALMLAFKDIQDVADPADTDGILGPVVSNSFTVFQYLLQDNDVLDQRYCCPKGAVRILRNTKTTVEAVCVEIDPAMLTVPLVNGELKQKYNTVGTSYYFCTDGEKENSKTAAGENSGFNTGIGVEGGTNRCTYRIWHPIFARSCSEEDTNSKQIKAVKGSAAIHTDPDLGTYDAITNEGCSLRWFERHDQVFGKGSTAIVGALAAPNSYDDVPQSASPLKALEASMLLKLFASAAAAKTATGDELTYQLAYEDANTFQELPAPQLAFKLSHGGFVYRFNEGDHVYKDGECAVYVVVDRACTKVGGGNGKPTTYSTKTYAIEYLNMEKIKTTEDKKKHAQKTREDVEPVRLSPADSDWPHIRWDGNLKPANIILNWGSGPDCPKQASK